MKERMPHKIASRHSRHSRTAPLWRIWPAALPMLLAGVAMPSQACTFAHLVVPIGPYFVARISTGSTVVNTDPLGCHGMLPLIIEHGATLNNLAMLTNDLGGHDGPNGRGGILVGGLFDNSASATVDNLGEFFLQRSDQGFSGVLKNAGRFVNQGLLSIESGGLVNSGTLINAGTLTSFDTVRNSGTLVNQGMLTFERSPGSWGPRFFATGGVIDNQHGGTLILTKVEGGSTYSNWTGSTLNNAGTLRGFNQVVGAADSVTLNLLAGGTVENSALSVAAGHTLRNDGNLVNTYVGLSDGSTFVNNGRIAGKSRIDINQQDSTLRNTGHIEVDGATLMNYGLLVNAGMVKVRASGRIDNGDAGQVQNDATLSVEGGTINNAGWIDNTGTLTNAGLIDNQGQLSRVSNSGRFDNAGTFTSPAELVNTGTIANAGDFRVGGSFELDGTFVNTGQMVFGAGSFTYGGGTYQQTGGVTRVDGSITIPTFELSGGRLCGSGRVSGSVVVSNSTVCPGNSPGKLHIGGGFFMLGGVLEIEIAGTVPGSFDVLQVDGVASFQSGVVKLMFADGYLPAPDAQWPFLQSTYGVDGLQTMRFDVSGLPAGYTTTIGADGLISFSSVPVPEPGSLALMVGGLLAMLGMLNSKRPGWRRRAQAASTG